MPLGWLVGCLPLGLVGLLGWPSGKHHHTQKKNPPKNEKKMATKKNGKRAGVGLVGFLFSKPTAFLAAWRNRCHGDLCELRTPTHACSCWPCLSCIFHGVRPLIERHGDKFYPTLPPTPEVQSQEQTGAGAATRTDGGTRPNN